MSTTYTSLPEARRAALALSQKNPTMYVAIGNCFGWMVVMHKRLNVFAPSDYTDTFGRTGTYWLNGKEKAFTAKQRIADQNATPDMN